jgi:hypothetical protein
MFEYERVGKQRLFCDWKRPCGLVLGLCLTLQRTLNLLPLTDACVDLIDVVTVNEELLRTANEGVGGAIFVT